MAKVTVMYWYHGILVSRYETGLPYANSKFKDCVSKIAKLAEIRTRRYCLATTQRRRAVESTMMAIYIDLARRQESGELVALPHNPRRQAIAQREMFDDLQRTMTKERRIWASKEFKVELAKMSPAEKAGIIKTVANLTSALDIAK